jgi:hypothetical protein
MAGSIRKAVLGMLAGAAASAPLALSLGLPRSRLRLQHGLGLGIWNLSVVVCRPADSFAVDLDWSLRLEGKRGCCFVPLAHRTLDLRRGHCIYIPPAGAAL